MFNDAYAKLIIEY